MPQVPKDKIDDFCSLRVFKLAFYLILIQLIIK